MSIVKSYTARAVLGFGKALEALLLKQKPLIRKRKNIKFQQAWDVELSHSMLVCYMDDILYLPDQPPWSRIWNIWLKLDSGISPSVETLQ